MQSRGAAAAAVPAPAVPAVVAVNGKDSVVLGFYYLTTVLDISILSHLFLFFFVFAHNLVTLSSWCALFMYPVVPTSPCSLSSVFTVTALYIA